MDELRAAASFWYLATPYSKHPDGKDSAFEQAAATAAFFINLGIPIFCPISHTHPIAVKGQMDQDDHDIWLPADQPFIDAASGLIVVMMPSWEYSYGIDEEIKEFEAAGKPVLYMEYPPTYGHDEAEMAAYFADQEVEHDLRTVNEFPKPKHFDSAFDTKAEMEAKVAK
jgi:hypothetical protein